MLKLNTTKVYADLLKIKVDLEFQPVPDPSYIQSKLIECSACQDRLEKMFLDATQELSEKDCLFRTEQYNVDCKKRDMLTNNDKIKKIPTGKEREAAADGMLEDEQRYIIALENELNTLRDVLGAVKLIQGNVNRKSADLKMMVRLMEQQVGRLGIGTKDDPGMSEMAKNISELSKLDSEMTTEDVENVSEYIEPEELPAAPRITGVVLSIDLELDDVLAGEPETEALTKSKVTDSRGTTPDSEVSPPKESETVDDVIAAFLTDDSEEDLSEEGIQEEEPSKESKSEEVVIKPVAATVATEGGSLTIRGEVDLDLDELGISLDDDTSDTKKPEKPSGTKKAESKSAVEVPPEKPVSKPEAKSTNEKPPVQNTKPTNVSPPTKVSSIDASEIDLDSILDNMR